MVGRINSLIEVGRLLVTCYCLMIPQTSSSTSAYSPKDVIKDYCEAEKFRASCSHDEVIEMKQAEYGRMKLGRCVQIDMGHLGCKEDVLDLADDLCSGRRSCEISIPEPIFEQTRPCLELKSYLKASYTCIKVNTLDSVDCTKPLRARLPKGRISSITTNESRCLGTYDTTWLIQGSPGQRVNISLLDFKVAAAHRRRPTSEDSHTVMHSQMSNGGEATCHKYATISESSEHRSTGTDHQQRITQSYLVLGQHHHQKHITDQAQPTEGNRSSVQVCGRRARWQHVYMSTSHVVEIKLEWHRANPNYYVIFYEVFGCPDPQLSSTMWFQRHNDMEATVGCQLSAGNWRLTCGIGNEWVGDTGNCTQYETFELAVRSTSAETTSNGGLLTAVLCICAFFIATIVIVTGVFLHRRRRRRGTSKPGSLSKTGSGAYDVTHRTHTSPKSDYGDLPEDYDDDIVISGADMAYVYPSISRTDDCHGTSSRHHRQSDGSQSGCDSVAYDVVDGTTMQQKSTSDGPYEKVSTCRYVHIWEMPLPKAPDE